MESTHSEYLMNCASCLFETLVVVIWALADFTNCLMLLIYLEGKVSQKQIPAK